MSARVTDEYPQGTPGSHEARDNGCICARMDNCNGLGFPYSGVDGPAFWITEGCPVHSPAASVTDGDE